MPELSQRAHTLPESPIRKLVPYAEEAKSRGVHVYHLNIGQPDLETPPAWWDAIANFDQKVLAYSHSAGNLSLREAIRKYYNGLGHSLEINQINVTTGASEALNFVFASIMNPGDELIVPEPFYANYNTFALAGQGRVVPLTTHIENSFALPSVEEFEKLITPKTRAITICNPGNPTGILYDLETLEKLRKVVLKHDLFLIADEVYREFAYDGYKHHSVLGMEGLEENAIVIDSVSKRFSACGARIGCVISRNAGVMNAVLKLSQARLSPPTLGQVGAEAVYSLPAEYYDEVVAEYSQRRKVLLDALRNIEGVIVPEVNGAFYAVAQLPVDDSEKFCTWMLQEFNYEGSTVMMAPGAGFYATPGLGTQQVRIAYVLNQTDLDKAMTCLAQGLEAYPGRVRVKSISAQN